MVPPADLTRRKILMASLLAPIAVNAAVTRGHAAQAPSGKTLVAYFSRSGNTSVIAGQISRSLGADLFEIEPKNPYPADYFETVEKAKQERDNGVEPPLMATVPEIVAYETVFLCFPIWGETAPPVIRSFLSTHDLSGKTLVPVITHGGYGLGSSLDVLRSHAPQAQLIDGFSMQAPQERQTVTKIKEWLEQRTEN